MRVFLSEERNRNFGCKQIHLRILQKMWPMIGCETKPIARIAPRPDAISQLNFLFGRFPSAPSVAPIVG
ncbi:UNVERIFIED_CONTAM: hypothetical protein Sradi_6898100 [Sesamum radiatum]|uniref:Uncharacterized protein n=1 Tax=Sesamum radiatum TaxID=300843 RepID=A0AAW2J0I1_SESRA